MKNEPNTYKSKKTVIIFSLIIIIGAILFLAFAYFAPIVTEENNYTTSGGATVTAPNIVYTDLSNGINLSGTYPMTDEEGLLGTPYDFRITNNESVKIKYEIYLQTESGNTISNNLVSISLDGLPPKVLTTFPTKTPNSGYSYSYKIDTGLINANSSRDFTLKAWLNKNGIISTVQNKNWYGKIFAKARFADDIGTDTILNIVAGSPTNSTDVITKEAPEGATCTNTLAYDGTTDNNLRYVGANPCNYVNFNSENDDDAGWRIIGVMNNIDDGTGNLETRIKLIRATSLGNYSWDSSEINNGYGVNDWTQADLKNELNGDYLDTSLVSNPNWYNGGYNEKNAIFDISKRLGTGAQELIGDAKWYLGGHYKQADRIPSTTYTKERGTTTWSTSHSCSDGACPRATEWTGKVALIYPSDYGYATAGGTTTNRSVCIGTLSAYNSSSGETWYNNSYSDCKNNDWLKPSSGSYWMLSPYSNSAYIAYMASVHGYVDYYNTGFNSAVLPAVYLKSSVSISGGSGTPTDPYILSN